MKIYTGPAIPTTYDPLWPSYTNLTPAQILSFQSFPQDLIKYLMTRRWLAETSGITVGGIKLNTQLSDQQKIAALKQGFDNGAITGSVSFFDASGNVQSVNSATATALYNSIVSFVQSTYSTAATLQSGVNANPATVTTRKAIDAAYAVIAPNSPSATNPSPT